MIFSRFTAAWCLLVLLGVHVHAQPVVVSDIRQVVRLAPAWRSVLSEESFPDYFGSDSLLNGQVLEKVGQLLQKKWPGASVKWANAKEIGFIRSGGVALPPPQIQADRSQGDIFVAIVQGLSPTTTATDDAGMPVTYFTGVCTVKAEDKAGKPLWESRVTVPFGTAVKPGSTYGVTEMSGPDWEKLFLASLEAALADTSRRLPAATYYRPAFTHPQYAPLLKNARQVTIHERVRDGLLYRKGEARRITFTVGEGKGAPVFRLDQQFVGNPEGPVGLSLTKATLTNETSNQEYRVIAEFSLPDSQVVPVEERRRLPVAVRCTAEGLLAGKFTLLPNQFEGEWGYDVYTIRRIAPKNTFEVRHNGKLLAVAQKGGIASAADVRTRDTYLLVDSAADAGTAAELQIIWLMYQMAHQFGQDFLDW